MRAILVLLGLVVLGLVVLMALGMVRVEQRQGAALPRISFDAEGGQLPAFSAETGKVGIGSTNTTIEVPTLEMKEKTLQVPTIEVQRAPAPAPSASPPPAR